MTYRRNLWRIKNIGCLSLLLFLGACSVVELDGDIQKGRMQLTGGDPKVALEYFERAAEQNPRYVTNFTDIPEGVWTYVVDPIMSWEICRRLAKHYSGPSPIIPQTTWPTSIWD
jgi:hypothetical protein